LESLLVLLVNQSTGTDPGAFIAGGQPVTNINQFPSFVGVQHSGITRVCGGIILNVNHVLTAGSCVLNENNHLIAASQLFVRAGDLTLGASATIPVLLVYVHPTFNPFTNVNDLAVLRTAANINLNLLGLEVANFNHDIVGDGTQCFIPGWNVVAGAPLHPLQFLMQPIMNRDDCNVIHSRRVAETMLCAGGVAANSGVCEVESESLLLSL
jgi:trypsin